VKIHADGEAHVAAGLVGAGQLIVTKLGSADAPLADESSPIRISGGLAQAMKDLSAAVEVVRKQLDPNEKDALLSMILDIVAELKAQTDPKAAGSLMAKIHQSTDDVNAVSASFRREADPAVAGSLMAQVHTSAADVNAVSAALRKEADAADKASLLAKVHASADSVKSFTGDAAAMATKIRPDIEATLGKVREYTEKDLAFILAKLRTANTDLVTTVGNLKVISGEGRELIVLNRKQLQDTIVNLKVMSDNLAAAAKEIRRNPWRLLHRPGEKATANENIYDAARAFGEGAGQLSDAIATLKAAEDAKGVLQKDDPLLVKIRAHLEASYEKFSKAEKGLWDALKQ